MNTPATPNVDPAELAKFTDAAHDWWNPESRSFGALHAINPLRLEWIESFVNLTGQRVLDVGCGGGILADAMARKVQAGAPASPSLEAQERQQAQAGVLGIDLGQESLHIAQLHALQAGTPCIQYRRISAEDLAQEMPATFDVVTCMEMLEHVPDPALVVQACARLVKPGGWVFFSTINRNWQAFAQAIVAAEYVLGLIPRGTHEYARLIQPAELMRWARQYGLAPKATRGLGYNVFSRRYHLHDDTRVNYLVATQKTL